jgi:hypothetical protein
MEVKFVEDLKEKIDELSRILNDSIIADEWEVVLKVSRELDKLIVKYLKGKNAIGINSEGGA